MIANTAAPMPGPDRQAVSSTARAASPVRNGVRRRARAGKIPDLAARVDAATEEA